MVGRPEYDGGRRVWKVTVRRGDKVVQLEPAHIVMASGVLGGPYIPEFANREQFPGTVIHTTQYMDAKPFTGKRVVVIGAGNTAIDVCQDLVNAKAESVTMVQRSATCVVSRSNVGRHMGETWAPGIHVSVGDLKNASTPLGFIKQQMIKRQTEQWAEEKELHAKLSKSGLKLTLGPEGAGQLIMVWERFGGTPHL